MAKVSKTICVYSPKGGVGKTVLSLNLAGVASSMGLRTLLVDLDVHNGCIGTVMDDQINKTIYNLTNDISNNRYKKASDYVYHYAENIDILPAPKDPRQGNKIGSSYIDLIIERLKTPYDLVIIDTESAMNEINVVTLDIVDEILFVIDNDFFTLKNIRSILTIFNDINKSNYKVLLNNSINFNNRFFNINEIKKIINSNIDYSITKGSYIRDITDILYNGKIPSLIPAFKKKCKADYETMKLIIDDVRREELSDEEN